MPQCNDALRSGGGDRHLWLTALPDNQILAHPSLATLLNLRKSDRERRGCSSLELCLSPMRGEWKQERQRATSPAKCCSGWCGWHMLDADLGRVDCGTLTRWYTRQGSRGVVSFLELSLFTNSSVENCGSSEMWDSW